MTDRQSQQLAKIAHWPASEIAAEMMKEADVDPLPGTPDLLTLLQWAVEDAALEYDLETGSAAMIQEEAFVTAIRSPAQAVRNLLQMNDPEEEVPAELNRATTRQEIAEAMISLANASVDRSPFA